MEKIIKYPRTPHIRGSRLQQGDEDLSQIPFAAIQDKYIVIEEKVDGANVAVSFNQDGELLLQSRGHFLTGGRRERDYDLFKIWAATRRDMLFDLLTDRYILYGEWLYVKHKVYYDALPAYFMEFDILDKQTGEFLDTERRKEMLKNTDIVSVPVLGAGVFKTQAEVLKFIGKSAYFTENRFENLRAEAARAGVPYEEILKETDDSDLMEGLYIKVEADGKVVDRMKYVRYGYVQSAGVADGDWLKKPIVQNKLKDGAEAF